MDEWKDRVLFISFAFTCLLHRVIISNLEQLSRNFPLETEESHINSVDWIWDLERKLQASILQVGSDWRAKVKDHEVMRKQQCNVRRCRVVASCYRSSSWIKRSARMDHSGKENCTVHCPGWSKIWSNNIKWIKKQVWHHVKKNGKNGSLYIIRFESSVYNIS